MAPKNTVLEWTESRRMERRAVLGVGGTGTARLLKYTGTYPKMPGQMLVRKC
jgi:hypothetical protein